MRLPLTKLEIFIAIAQQGSLRSAAEVLGIKPSTVSHQLKSLETQLDAPLFIRTTRSVQLTEAGRALIRGAGPAFDQLTDSVESAKSTGHAAKGSLKLAMPDFVYHLFVGPKLRAFKETYPEIEIELSLTDALTDILSDGFHAGFRLGDRISNDMVAVRITQPLDLAVVASPSYLQAFGVPTMPKDLLEHECIQYRFQSSGRLSPWSFLSRQGEFEVDVKGRFTANTLPAVIDLAVQGLGLAYTFQDYCAEERANGQLKTVLMDHLPKTPGVFIYFPREYRRMVPLRLFMEVLKTASP